MVTLEYCIVRHIQLIIKMLCRAQMNSNTKVVPLPVKAAMGTSFKFDSFNFRFWLDIWHMIRIIYFFAQFLNFQSQPPKSISTFLRGMVVWGKISMRSMTFYSNYHLEIRKKNLLLDPLWSPIHNGLKSKPPPQKKKTSQKYPYTFQSMFLTLNSSWVQDVTKWQICFSLVIKKR